VPEADPALVTTGVTGAQTPQSPGQVAHVSVPLQLWSPQAGGGGGHAPQSSGQFEQSSPDSHPLAPQVGPLEIHWPFVQDLPAEHLLLSSKQEREPEFQLRQTVPPALQSQGRRSWQSEYWEQLIPSNVAQLTESSLQPHPPPPVQRQ
jgi:hypothetical protein